MYNMVHWREDDAIYNYYKDEVVSSCALCRMRLRVRDLEKEERERKLDKAFESKTQSDEKNNGGIDLNHIVREYLLCPECMRNVNWLESGDDTQKAKAVIYFDGIQST